MPAHEAVIVAVSRTPVGSLYGSLKTLTAPQLGAIALKHAFEHSNVDPAVVEEIYFGNVVQAGVGQSPARQVALAAGMKVTSPVTIKGKKGDTVIKEDEEHKKVIFEKVPSLKSAFKIVVRVAEKLLQLDPAKVNMDGGAVSDVSVK